MIIIEFDENITVDQAKQKIKDEVDSETSSEDWPTFNNAKVEPNIFDLSMSEEIPILNINISGDYPVQRLKEFGEYLDRLGNHLVLEGKLNSSIKNGAYSNKLRNSKNKDYSNSKLDLPKEIIQNTAQWAPANHWDFESVQKRQIYLATNYAAKVWEIVW